MIWSAPLFRLFSYTADANHRTSSREIYGGGIAEKGYLMKYLFCGFGRVAGALDFGGKTPRHRMVAQAFSHCDALFKDFDRTVNSAPAEQNTGFAKDLGVALALFCTVHEA